MRGHARLVVATLAAVGLLFLEPPATSAADPEIDALLRSPVAKDWITNGGNLTNQRYSTLKQIDRTNVKQLKGAWMTRLKGSGLGGKYSFEATPLVKDGIMYVVTGNDDVFALNAKTGEFLWEYWSGIDQRISTICCGWVNRGLAMGEGLIFLGQLDSNVVALDIKTGKVAWKTPIEKWENGYGITSAPLYYDGIIYSGITGGEFGVRGRLTALDAKTGKILWVWYTLPGPGEIGADTWPPGTDHHTRGGATIWNTPALDPELGLIYFAVGNCGPDYDGSMREGDNLFCTSIVALKAKTGEYAWHFQTTPGETWDFTATQPIILADLIIDGQERKVLMHAPKNGYFYVLDRITGKFISGKPFVKRMTWSMGLDKNGRPIEAPGARYTTDSIRIWPGAGGAHNWAPMSYSPITGLVYFAGNENSATYVPMPPSEFRFTPGRGNTGLGRGQGPIPDTEYAATQPEVTGRFLVAWDPVKQQERWRVLFGTAGGGAGPTLATAGGLVFSGNAAYNAETGERVWEEPLLGERPIGWITYMLDGKQYVSVTARSNPNHRLFTFTLDGGATMPPLPPAAPAQGRGGRGAAPTQ